MTGAPRSQKVSNSGCVAVDGDFGGESSGITCKRVVAPRTRQWSCSQSKHGALSVGSTEEATASTSGSSVVGRSVGKIGRKLPRGAWANNAPSQPKGGGKRRGVVIS